MGCRHWKSSKAHMGQKIQANKKTPRPILLFWGLSSLAFWSQWPHLNPFVRLGLSCSQGLDEEKVQTGQTHPEAHSILVELGWVEVKLIRGGDWWQMEFGSVWTWINHIKQTTRKLHDEERCQSWPIWFLAKSEGERLLIPLPSTPEAIFRHNRSSVLFSDHPKSLGWGKTGKEKCTVKKIKDVWACGLDVKKRP